MRMNKRLFNSICMLAIASLCFLATSFFYLSMTFSWFAGKGEAEGNGMDIVLESDKYDIYIVDSNKYDNDNIYEGIEDFKTKLGLAGKRFFGEGIENFNDTYYTAPSLALELDNEVWKTNDSGNTDYYLVPGSHGSFSLYVKPKTDDDFSLSLTIELSGYKKVYVEGVGGSKRATAQIPTNDLKFSQALNMLRGHILFFGGRTATVTNNVTSVTSYSNFLGNRITFNTADETHNILVEEIKDNNNVLQYYKLTIFWEWPLLFSDISENGVIKDRYPSSVGTYIAANRDYFFAINANSNDDGLLNDGYNEGDQLIGDNIHYLVVTLK